MLFNSYIFIFLFFPLVITGYFILCRARYYKGSLAFLIGMSLWFYGYNNIYYLPILAVSVLFNYGLTFWMSHAGREVIRKCCLVAGILLNLFILFYFKYYDFFIQNINAIFKTDLSLFHLLLPLGISFYTFQQLSYVIDVYKGEGADYSFLEYAAYVTYFPQLIAGPIVYHSELITQFRDPIRRKPDYENLSRGLYAFSFGLAKKVLIADTMSKLVNVGYQNLSVMNTVSTAVVMLCYAMQIYFDFSGYCDMAYGMAYMMNIELPINFNSPYKAESITDIWNRWHITLSRFFTKYVYIPLGGSRKGAARTYLNIFIIFLISGFWHGANWTYILWGMIQGILILIEKLLHVSTWKIPRQFKKIMTFITFTFTLVVFRAANIAEIGQVFRQLFSGGVRLYRPIESKFLEIVEINFLQKIGFGMLIENYPWLVLTVFLTSLLIACFTTKNTQEKIAAMKFSVRELLTMVFLMVWSIISLSEISEFMYFHF